MNAKRITKATVRAALKNVDADGLTVDVDSEMVAVWYAESEKEYDLSHEVREAKAQAVIDAVCAATGATSVSGNGSKLWVYYKNAPTDKGDWNDRTSAWHY